MSDYGKDVFYGKDFQQHLSVYEGLSTVKGDGITARILAWNEKDVIATEISDQRNVPSAIHIDLRMLRYAINFIRGQNWNLTSRHAIAIQTGSPVDPHTAISRLEMRGGCIILIQEFKERDFYCSSAVAVRISGRNSKASYYNESTVRLSAEPGKGSFLILASSASSFDPEEDVAGLALQQLDAANDRNFDELLNDNRDWWGRFWEKSLVHLTSTDGAANNIEMNHTYFLYIMASCSRGDYMPGFRGMLWYTNGDLAMWGSQYWWNNLGGYFNGLTPFNRPELLDPVFSTHSRHYEAYALAAHQQWGSNGIWIPETNWFNGPEELPGEIAGEMRDLFLVRKPWEERSQAFMDFAWNKNFNNSRWNWRYYDYLQRTREQTVRARGPGAANPPFAWTTHIFSTTAKISYLYWLRYAYYLDREWLETTAYPMIRGTAEFYRSFPNLYLGTDGKYHIRHVNNLESDWASEDTPEELLAMHAMLPIAIRASEILGIDAELRLFWREILDKLAPLPVSMEPGAYYNYCNIGSRDQPIFQSVLEAYNKRYPEGVDEQTRIGILSRYPLVAAHLGLAEEIKYMIPAQIREEQNIDRQGCGVTGLGILRNRLMLGEGPGAIECERLGSASHALQLALLQSAPPVPGEIPVNYVFPAWPRDWDAQFSLAARDAFVIGASMEGGEIEFVEIRSNRGGLCRLKNPWAGNEVTVYRNGKEAEGISGELLALVTEEGEFLVLVPRGKKPIVKHIK